MKLLVIQGNAGQFKAMQCNSIYSKAMQLIQGTSNYYKVQVKYKGNSRRSHVF